MAKVTSALMGTTRGSVGNVTLRRSNGQTVASQKVTDVKNPRSFAQAEQRMRMAAATTFYSPLSDVLAKAWQDKNRTESMGEFTRAAIATMRSRGYGFVKTWPTLRPYPFQVSKGSLPGLYDSVGVTDWLDYNGANIKTLDTIIPAASDEPEYTVGAMYDSVSNYIGLSVRKLQLTFVLMFVTTDDSGVMVFRPRYGRIMLTNDDTRTLRSVLPPFVTTSNFLREEQVGFNIVANEFGGTANGCAAAALIISGHDGKKWLRSTEYMTVAPYWISAWQASYQIGVESFMDAASVNAAYGDVYLDGQGTQGREDTLVSYAAKLSTGGDVTVTGFDWLNITIDGQQETVAAAVLSDGRTLPMSGDSRMPTYNYLFGRSNTQIGPIDAQEVPVSVVNGMTDAAGLDYWQWVSRASGLPLATFLILR